MEKKRIAIVILNWNGAHMLRRFLPSVVEHSANVADIIVADNASTDDSLDLIARDFQSVQTIVLDRNYGFAGGYNHALKKVDNEYYMLLNSDVEVTECWLERLADFLDKHTDVAACQPKLHAEHSRDMFEYAGASGGFIDRYGYPFCRGRIFDAVEKDYGQYDDDAEIMWATGACMLIRRDDFWRVGGFDERFFAHNEEIDLCWRLSNLGRKIYCVPGSVVFHVGGGTLPKANPMKTFLNFRNNLTMLYKNLPAADLAKVMRIRQLLDYIAALKSLIVDRNVGEFKAILRARRAFKAWLSDFEEDRRSIQASRVSASDRMRESYSILWQYYVHGVKRFKDLKK